MSTDKSEQRSQPPAEFLQRTQTCSQSPLPGPFATKPSVRNKHARCDHPEDDECVQIFQQDGLGVGHPTLVLRSSLSDTSGTTGEIHTDKEHDHGQSWSPGPQEMTQASPLCAYAPWSFLLATICIDPDEAWTKATGSSAPTVFCAVWTHKSARYSYNDLSWTLSVLGRMLHVTMELDGRSEPDGFDVSPDTGAFHKRVFDSYDVMIRCSGL